MKTVYGMMIIMVCLFSLSLQAQTRAYNPATIHSLQPDLYDPSIFPWGYAYIELDSGDYAWSQLWIPERFLGAAISGAGADLTRLHYLRDASSSSNNMIGTGIPLYIADLSMDGTNSGSGPAMANCGVWSSNSTRSHRVNYLNCQTAVWTEDHTSITDSCGFFAICDKGIVGNSVDTLIVQFCTFKDCSTGIQVSGKLSSDHTQVVIASNEFTWSTIVGKEHVYLINSEGLIVNNYIIGKDLRGVGVMVKEWYETRNYPIIIKDNLIAECRDGVYLYGYLFSFYTSKTKIDNNHFINNQHGCWFKSGFGEGMAPAMLKNNIFASSAGDSTSIAFGSETSSPLILIPMDSLGYNHYATELLTWPEIDTSDLGPGNTFGDPMLHSFDYVPPYALQPGSSCINSGDPSPEFNDTDGTRNDKGCYGGSYGDWGYGASLVIPESSVKPNECSIQIYPNPFNAEVNIDFNGAGESVSKIEICDILGRRMAGVNVNYPNQHLNLQWDGKHNGRDCPSGQYFVRVIGLDGQILATQQIVLLK